MKNTINIIGKIILVILIIQTLYIPKVQATANHWGNIITGADDFLELGQPSNESADGDKVKIQNAVSFIYNVFFAAGVVVAVITGLILGVMYMTQSIEEQAKVKETLIIYAVGCIVTFGAFGIWKIVITILQQM